MGFTGRLLFNKRNLFVYLPLVVSLAGCSSSEIPSEECQAGQVVTGFKNGKPVCAPAPAITPCQSGQVMTGTNADGTPVCATQEMVCPDGFTSAPAGTPTVCYKTVGDAVQTLRKDATREDVTWKEASDLCSASGGHLCFHNEMQNVCETVGSNNLIIGMWLGDSISDDLVLFVNGTGNTGDVPCGNFEGSACKTGYTLTKTENNQLVKLWMTWGTCCDDIPYLKYNSNETASCCPTRTCTTAENVYTSYFVGGYCCIDPQPKIQ
jgi:hypothetical protein